MLKKYISGCSFFFNKKILKNSDHKLFVQITKKFKKNKITILKFQEQKY